MNLNYLFEQVFLPICVLSECRQKNTHDFTFQNAQINVCEYIVSNDYFKNFELKFQIPVKTQNKSKYQSR